MRQDTMRSCRSRARPVLAVALAWTSVALTVVTAAADAAVDQSNDRDATTSYSCGSSGGSLWQSFTPGAANLAALDLRFRAGGAFPDGGAHLVVAIRTGDPGGQVLATSDAIAPGPQAAGANLRVRFAFAPAASLTPGATYVIEFQSPAPAGTSAGMVASWFGRFDDPYPAGRAYGCDGVPIGERDYNFVTYSDAPGTPTAPPVEPTAAAWSVPPGVCPQIVARVPHSAIERAVADPTRVEGYDQLERPGRAPGPYNRVRRHLTLRTLAVPYHPLGNGLVYAASCP